MDRKLDLTRAEKQKDGFDAPLNLSLVIAFFE